MIDIDIDYNIDDHKKFTEEVKALVPNTLSKYPLFLKSEKKDEHYIAFIINLSKTDNKQPYVVFNQEFCERYNNKPISEGVSEEAKNLFKMIYLHELLHIHVAPGIKDTYIAIESMVDAILEGHSNDRVKNILSDMIINATLSKYGYFDDKLIRSFTNSRANYKFNDFNFEELSLEAVLDLYLSDINTLNRNRAIKLVQQELSQRHPFIAQKMDELKDIVYRVSDNIKDRLNTYITLSKITKEVGDYIETHNNKIANRQENKYGKSDEGMDAETDTKINQKQKTKAGSERERDLIEELGNILGSDSDDDANSEEIEAEDNQMDEDEGVDAEIDNTIQDKDDIFDEKNISSEKQSIDIDDLKNAEEILKNADIDNQTKQRAISHAQENFKKNLKKKLCGGRGVSLETKNIDETLIDKIIDYYINDAKKEDYKELMIGNLSKNQSFLLPLYNVKSGDTSYRLPEDTIHIKSMIRESLQNFGNPTKGFAMMPYQQPYQFPSNLAGQDVSNNLSDVCFIIDTSGSVNDDTVIKSIKMISTMFENMYPSKVRIMLFSSTVYYDTTFDYTQKKHSFIDIITSIAQTGISRGGTYLSPALKRLDEDRFIGNIVLITDAELLQDDAFKTARMLEKLYYQGCTIFTAIVNKYIPDAELQETINSKSAVYHVGTDVMKVIYEICNSIKENYDFILSDILNRNKLSM